MQNTTTTNTTITRSVRRARATRLGAALTTATFVATGAGAVLGVGTAGAQPATTTPPPTVPSVAAFVDDLVADFPFGETGTASGAELAHLGAHLQEDRRYHYVQLDGGIDIDLPFDAPGFELVPDRLELPVGEPIVVVVDPTEPYVYVGGPCPDVSDDPPDRERDDGDRTAETVEKLAELVAGGDDPIPVLPSQVTGPECGIGFSANGNIPAPATAEGEAFSGHVVVDGTVPVHPAVEVDGSVVARVDDHGLRAAGFGDVIASVPFVDALVDISLPIAEAGVEVEVTDQRIGVAVDGSIGLDASYELPLLGVPLTLPAHGSIEAGVRFGTVRTGDVWTVDPSSFLEIDGHLAIGLGSLGAATGLDLHDVAGADASVRIDRTGARVTGRADLQIHPALRTGAGADFDLFASATDLSQSFLRFDADVTVGGTRLAGAGIDVSSRGLFVAGTARVGSLDVELGGQITPRGADLRGRASIEFPLDALRRLSQSTTAAIEDARAEVRRIRDDIDAMRTQVRAERTARNAALRTARADLQRAEDDLARIQQTIDANNARIAQRRRWIADANAWFRRLGWGDALVHGPAHAARLASWETQIGADNAANVTQAAYRTAAQALLRELRTGLTTLEQELDRAPVDDDARIQALLATQRTADDVLRGLQAGAARLDVTGSVRGEIAFAAGTSGLSGRLTARYCDDGRCTTLAGGRVVLGGRPTACVDVLGLGEVCARL